MTLATNIIVLDPVPIDDLFTEMRRLLGASDNVEILDDWLKSWTSDGTVEDKGGRVRSHPGGIGLPAWLMIDYAVDAPLPTKLQREETERDRIKYGEDGGFDGPRYENHFARIDLDTAHGYSNGRGGGCSELHAWLVREIGQWLEARSKRYTWQNEFTGEWYDSWRDVDKLGDPDKGVLPRAA